MTRLGRISYVNMAPVFYRLEAEVVVWGRILERRLQGSVADQELRVGLLSKGNVVGIRQQHLRQHNRGRRLGRDRHRAHVLERLARHELDRIHRPFRAHAQPGQQP